MSKKLAWGNDALKPEIAIEMAWRNLMVTTLMASSSVARLSAALRGAPAVVFGGAVRSAFADEVPKDVDVVVDMHPRILGRVLKACFGGENLEENAFGGFKVKMVSRREEAWCNHPSYADVWSLGKTWAFAAYDIEPSFENLVERTTFFDIEACAVELHAGSVAFDRGMVAAMKSSVLGIKNQLGLRPFPIVQAARAANFCMRYGMKASEELKATCRMLTFDGGGQYEREEALFAAQQRYWGEARVTWKEFQQTILDA